MFKIKPRLFGKNKKVKKYSLAAIVDAFDIKAKRDTKKMSPDSPAAIKTGLECDILREKLKRVRGEVIDLEQHYQEIDEIATVVNAGLQQWVQWVTARFGNPEILKKAKEQRDNVRRWLAQKMKE